MKIELSRREIIVLWAGLSGIIPPADEKELLANKLSEILKKDDAAET